MKIGLIRSMAIAVVSLVLFGCNQDVERYGVELDRSDVIQGMDLNGNGVRDDLDVYITKNFTAGAQRNAVLDLVLSYQKALVVDKGNIEVVKLVANQYASAVYCVFNAFPDARLPDGSSLHLILQGMVVNTDQRRFEYSLYNEVLRGYVAPYPKTPNCR